MVKSYKPLLVRYSLYKKIKILQEKLETRSMQETLEKVIDKELNQLGISIGDRDESS